LVVNETVDLPGSELQVTMERYRYGRGLTEDGRPTVVKWAELIFSKAGSHDVSSRYDLDRSYEVLGERVYITGSRSEVLVYALPPSPPMLAGGPRPD
jgi:hypothetical protein